MQNQAFNPYLPSYEYIPDAEPRVFGDRVYIYGSHDRFNWPIFCLNDYVCWSAPLSDLSDWHYEGVIYRKKQDPMNKLGLRCLYAPDLVQGPDGRYYLYYAFDFMGVMGVAVADTPIGPFEFYGHIHFQDGHRWGSRSGEPFPFDPGVLVDDDGRVYLYSGFATKTPPIASRGANLTNPGGVVLELDKDMLTIVDGPTLLFPRKGNNAPEEYRDHEFFEASSIRKICGKYYFVYSSQCNYELCYAVSDSPKGPFTYGGVLVNLGDVGLEGVDETHARDYLGNTHGGMVQLNGTWYIFYHRQTNRHSYSRQACAEPLVLTEDGRFLQAERTSCGLNGGPLRDLGFYPSSIACNLRSSDGAARIDIPLSKWKLHAHPYLTQNGKDGNEEAIQYIRNMRNGAVAGFKSFAFREPRSVRVTVSGKGDGEFLLFLSEDFTAVPAASIPLHVNREIVSAEAKLELTPGTYPLYFRYVGSGSIDFYSFELI